MKIKFLSILIVLFVSCKNDKNPVENETVDDSKVVITDPPKAIIFEVDLTTTQPDEFKLFANEIFLNNSQHMNISIGQKLNLNETSKKMIFRFPENIKPDFQMGFGLGTKFKKEIRINEMMLSFGKTTFNIKPEELEKYFTFNKFTEYNSSMNKIKTKKVDGKHNPLIFFRRRILDSIQNIN